MKMKSSINLLYASCNQKFWTSIANQLFTEERFIPRFWIGDLSEREHSNNYLPTKQRLNYLFPELIIQDLIPSCKDRWVDEVGNLDIEANKIESWVQQIPQYRVHAIKMIERQDVYYTMDESEKWRFFIKILTRALTIVKTLDVNFFIGGQVPHHISTFSLYLSCKYLDIPTVFFVGTCVPEMVIPFEDVFKNNLGNCNSRNVHKGIQSDQLKNELERINSKSHPLRRLRPEYNYLHFVTRILKAYKLFKTTKSYYIPKDKNLKRYMSNLEQSMLKIRDNKRTRSLQTFYESLCAPFDLNSPFVLVALHMQPEATTCPLGGQYVDQLLMVKHLHDNLPNGWSLYVKEHSAQFKSHFDRSIGRSKDFYRYMDGLPNVRLISSELSSFELINKSKAVATVTGTIGWEALVNGIPVLAFGNAWYSSCSGCYEVDSSSDVKKALSEIEKLNDLRTFDTQGFLSRIESECAWRTPSDPNRPTTISSDVAASSHVRVLRNYISLKNKQ